MIVWKMAISHPLVVLDSAGGVTKNTGQDMAKSLQDRRHDRNGITGRHDPTGAVRRENGNVEC
jgi:hypothetical protein